MFSKCICTWPHAGKWRVTMIIGKSRSVRRINNVIGKIMLSGDCRTQTGMTLHHQPRSCSGQAPGNLHWLLSSDLVG
uniref:Uncharacterized protein n=1 Tax=Rhizophora mucronata TaxID=61149 RepID=A0A2P2KXN9_RHIMU